MRELKVRLTDDKVLLVLAPETVEEHNFLMRIWHGHEELKLRAVANSPMNGAWGEIYFKICTQKEEV